MSLQSTIGSARGGTENDVTGIEYLRHVLSNKTALPESYVAIIQEFLRRIDHLRQPCGKRNGFELEYDEVRRSVDHAPGYAAALTPQTPYTCSKNRYRDVLPFESTRVRLVGGSNHPEGDYMNANYVDSTYIACCAPIPSVIADFWRMVWQTNVHVILMLTNFVERERIKADLYWDPEHRVVNFNGISVQLVSEKEHPASHGFLVRMFKVWSTEELDVEPRMVEHIQLTIWPDHGVLRDYRVVAPMLQLVNDYLNSAARASRVEPRAIVHCSAGIGRSGTFIAIDVILKSIERALRVMHTSDAEQVGVRALQDALDVKSVVYRLRSQRPGMVQMPEQYEMIYRYIAAVLTNEQPW